MLTITRFINFDHFQRDPSSGHFRSEPTFLDERIPSPLEPPTMGVEICNVPEDPSPSAVSIRFPIDPVPVPVGLAAVLAPLPALAVAVAPVLVAPDTADVEVAEPQVVERPQLATHDFRSTNDDIFKTTKYKY